MKHCFISAHDAEALILVDRLEPETVAIEGNCSTDISRRHRWNRLAEFDHLRDLEAGGVMHLECISLSRGPIESESR